MSYENLVKTPILGSSPAGRDARYEPEFADLQAEIDKLNSVTHVQEVDWKRVVNLAGIILETKAKDLLAAAYMSVGLMHVQEMNGVVLGVRIMADMIAIFWEDCFPARKRMRGRINALVWWEEKTRGWLKSYSVPQPLPAELHKNLLTDVRSLDKALGEVLPDMPSLRELIGIIERLPVESPQQQEVLAPEESIEHPQDTSPYAQPSPVQPQPAPQSPAQPTNKPAAPEDSTAARKTLAQAALTFAELSRNENPTDPLAWKAARIGAWINVKAMPPAQEGQTLIPGPNMAVKTALLTQLADGKLLEAARSAEDHFTGAIFWLDLQRIVAQALEGLGDEYLWALDAVRGEVCSLLRHLPGLGQLSFADGTPFADPETRAWLNSLATGHGNTQQDASSDRDDLVTRTLEQAGKRFTKKDEASALDLISQAVRQAPDGPSRFRLRLGQMDLLCRSARFSMAAALADELLAEIQSRGLEDWDPPLAVQILLASREAYVGLGGDEYQAKARALAARISRIRPSAAMNLLI
jgi:type VI secretion system protein VasJ